MTLYVYNSQMFAADGFYNRPIAAISPASSITLVEVVEVDVDEDVVEVEVRE